MPTYVYECSHCTKQFEAQQRITEDPLDTCICGSKGTIKRVIQPIAVVFKGSGFHINDYSASTTAKQSSADAEAAPTESKVEAAPAVAEPKPADSAAAPLVSAPSAESASE